MRFYGDSIFEFAGLPALIVCERSLLRHDLKICSHFCLAKMLLGSFFGDETWLVALK